MTISGFSCGSEGYETKSRQGQSQNLHLASFLTASLVACASCSAPSVVCSGVAAGAAPGIMELGSSINPPPPNGTGVKPGMTGGAALHAAGPNAN